MGSTFFKTRNFDE
jgi:hypothetical protein